MSNKIKIGLLVVFVFAGFTISAQEFYNSLNPLTTASNTLNYKLTGNQYYFLPKYIGSVYLNEEWSVASVKLENGDIYEDVYMKLNTLFDEVVVYNDRIGSVFILDKSIVDEFAMDPGFKSYKLFRKVIFDRAPRGEHYVNVLYDGEVKLYVFHRTDILKTSLYKDVIHGSLRDSEYKSEVNYYIVFPDNSMQKVFMNRRSFLQLFPEQKRSLRRLYRKNKIRFSTSEELIQATQIIEQEIF